MSGRGAKAPHVLSADNRCPGAVFAANVEPIPVGLSRGGAGKAAWAGHESGEIEVIACGPS
jgi:hypothetical protein